MNAPQVLIVEDDADIATALTAMLAKHGFSSVRVANGAEAISWLEGASPPCTVLVDLLMPGIVGQELLEYLRADVRLAAIPVAIVSGSPQLAPEGYRVFRKPLDLQPLIDFVREGCRGAP